MTTQTFHLGDLLSVATDRLVSPSGLDGVHRLLTHMTGDGNLMTHQYPMAGDAVQPHLLEQHPWLAQVTLPEFSSPAAVMLWLELAVETWGAWHEVESCPMAWGAHDPIVDFPRAVELAQMRLRG